MVVKFEKVCFLCLSSSLNVNFVLDFDIFGFLGE